MHVSVSCPSCAIGDNENINEKVGMEGDDLSEYKYCQSLLYR